MWYSILRCGIIEEMKNKRLKIGLFVACILGGLIFANTIVSYSPKAYDYDDFLKHHAGQERPFTLLKKVQASLKAGYVDPELEDQELEYGAIEGMLASLDDPYTRFIRPKNYKEMKIRMEGAFFGIGIHIGIRDKQLMVISPIAGTPADKAGLKAKDKIMNIDGTSTKGMGLTDAVSIIRGPKGSKVVLGVISAGDKNVRDVAIVRDKIDINVVDKKELFDESIGYIRLTSFENQNAPYEMQKAIQELERDNMDALIVDLRNNGGGLLRNAIDIANMFMSTGDIVHTIDRNGNKETQRVYNAGTLFPDKPLVLLINGGSASASEILAGAIKDNKRGIILGEHSFGKASVQRVINLDDGSAILMTVAKYYTPDGTDISEKGINVDIEVGIPTANIEAAKQPDYEYTYENDPQLQAAIEEIKKLI